MWRAQHLRTVVCTCTPHTCAPRWPLPLGSGPGRAGAGAPSSPLWRGVPSAAAAPVQAALHWAAAAATRGRPSSALWTRTRPLALLEGESTGVHCAKSATRTSPTRTSSRTQQQPREPRRQAAQGQVTKPWAPRHGPPANGDRVPVTPCAPRPASSGCRSSVSLRPTQSPRRSVRWPVAP